MMGLVEGIQFKDNFNSIIYSCKKSIPHQFDEFKLVFDDRDYVNGEVIAHYTDIAVVKLSYKNVTVQAYIYKSKVSACAFINNEDIPIYLPKGSSFKFVIERMDEKNSIVEVSRKPYRQELDDVEIGVAYPVYFTKFYNGKYFFYSQSLEGYVFRAKNIFQVGKEIEVLPTSTTSQEFIISK